MTMLGPNTNLIDVPGSRLALTTPALVLDLDKFEKNLAALALMCGVSGQRMRPHAKTHKCSEIAKRQIEAGAVGVCCATLHEAENMVAAGVEGVLISSPVVGASKINRLIEANRRAPRLKAVVDNPTNLRELADAAGRAEKPLEVLVDIDVGMQRTGVNDIETAIELARQIQHSQNLAYRGIQAYSGKVQHIDDYGERKAAYSQQLSMLQQLLDALSDAGLKPDIVTGGGTGTHDIDREMGLFTELQTGSYIFMDVEYNAVELQAGGDSPFETSLFMQCSVVSNNADGFVTIDGGYKCFATDGPKPAVLDPNLPGATYDRFGDEHGKIDLASGSAKPGLGTPVTLITPHCDPTVNLHNYYHCVRGDRLVDIWPVDGRGVL